MGLLGLLWWSSLLMSGGAILWMVALIVGRKRRESRQARLEADQSAVRLAFLDALAGKPDALLRMRPLSRRPALMADGVVEILSVIRGRDRDRLVEALTALGVDSRLRRSLESGRRAARVAVAEALAAFPGPETASALTRAFPRSRDDEFRVAALSSLLDIGAAPPLGEMLAQIAARGQQSSLYYEPVLRRIAVDAPASAVEALRDPTVDADLKALIVEALGGTGDYAFLGEIAALARSPELEVRTASVRALGALSHPAAEPAVAAGLSNPAWQVRAAACEAAGKVGLVSLAPRLSEALADEAWWVRYRAGEALANLGGKGVEGLRSAARAGDDVTRRAAALALAETGVPELAPA